MSRFICNLCNKEFTSKYGLKKHNDKKIPCNAIPIKKAKNVFKCTICDKILSSKQNLDNHMFNHRLDAIKVNNIETTTETAIDDHLENNLIEEDLINISIPKPNNSIEILSILLSIFDFLSLTIATAVPKGDRLDFMLQKLTELNVSKIILMNTKRSVVMPRETKQERLKRILIEACKIKHNFKNIFEIKFI
jgi:hypothetical protein